MHQNPKHVRFVKKFLRFIHDEVSNSNIEYDDVAVACFSTAMGLALINLNCIDDVYEWNERSLKTFMECAKEALLNFKMEENGY